MSWSRTTCINTGPFHQIPSSVYLLAHPNKPGLLLQWIQFRWCNVSHGLGIWALPSVVLFDDEHIITFSHGWEWEDLQVSCACSPLGFYFLESTQVGCKLFEDKDCISTSAGLCFYSQHQRQSHSIVHTLHTSCIYIKETLVVTYHCFFVSITWLSQKWKIAFVQEIQAVHCQIS